MCPINESARKNTKNIFTGSTYYFSNNHSHGDHMKNTANVIKLTYIRKSPHLYLPKKLPPETQQNVPHYHCTRELWNTFKILPEED